jgi:hypothetical protein
VNANLAAGLRAVAEALPTGAVVPVPREALLELLEAVEPIGISPVDPTVEEIAKRYGRAPSTVRGWCEAGRFSGAYKLHDREWRIPLAAIETFESQERLRERLTGRRGRGVRSLSDWRHVS